MKSSTVLLLAILAGTASGQTPVPAATGGDLRNLATLRDGVKRQRISSYDRTGANRDFLSDIKPGAMNDRGDDYSSTAYWYQVEPHTQFPPLAAAADRLPIDRWKAEPIK
jgi:hypothetical protein